MREACLSAVRSLHIATEPMRLLYRSNFHGRQALCVVVLWAWTVAGAGCGSASKMKGDGGSGAGEHDGDTTDVPIGNAGARGSAGADGSAGSSGRAGGTDANGTLPACPGSTPSAQATACRTSADCPTPSWICGPTYSSAGCGVCLPAPHECSADGGCTAEQVCLPSASPCNCNGQGTVCGSRCMASSCAAGNSCDPMSGLCEPTPCGAAFTCADGLICAPNRTGADVHGCATAHCATDGYVCPSGYTCAAGPVLDPNGCEAVSCVGGAYHCPSNTDCNRSSSSPHHCERRSCTSDRNCDCGACIQGYCQDQFYVCSPPPAV
jgi:hypothetical protein